MPYPSKYPGTCKDCGATYAKGDMIDQNGKESLNKNREMKPHWCPDGENCKGAMQTKGIDFSKMQVTGRTEPDYTAPKDPTPEQFLGLGKSMMSPLLTDEAKDEYVKKMLENTRYKIAEELIKRSAIEKAMNDLGMQHPGRRGFVEDVLR